MALALSSEVDAQLDKVSLLRISIPLLFTVLVGFRTDFFDWRGQVAHEKSSLGEIRICLNCYVGLSARQPFY